MILSHISDLRAERKGPPDIIEMRQPPAAAPKFIFFIIEN